MLENVTQLQVSKIKNQVISDCTILCEFASLVCLLNTHISFHIMIYWNDKLWANFVISCGVSSRF